jgi:hypothetical protein
VVYEMQLPKSIIPLKSSVNKHKMDRIYTLSMDVNLCISSDCIIDMGSNRSQVKRIEMNEYPILSYY